jgi:multidrug efflux system membrane fusion protein
MKVRHVVVSTAVVVAAFLAAACTGAQGTEAPPPRPVRVQSLTVAATPGNVRYSATVEAAEQVPLAFKATGYVDDLLRRRAADGRLRAVQAGDLVQKGTVLARVRDTEYREQVNRGRARVVESEVGLEKARLDLERAKTLFAAESLIKPDLDAAQAAFDSGQARLAAARADAELAVTSMRDTELMAPTTGVLLERRVEVGSLVGAGTLGFVLGDISAVKARFGVPDSMVRTMVAGEQIDLVVEAVAGASFEGRITGIAPAADPQSRVFDIEVTIPNADGRLRPGMIGTVVVRTTGTQREPATPLFTVPLTAIVRDAAGSEGTARSQANPSAAAQADYALFVVERQGDADLVRRRRVQLGDVIGNGVVVSKGVQPGERIVVTGATLLVEGERVRIVP